MAKRVVVPKTRNGGTFSESAFWSFIRSSLRRRTMVWLPIKQCKLKAKRPYKGINKRQKFEYKCNVCKKYFPEKEVSVDHIKPVGTLTCANDLPQFVENLFCEEYNLQTICSKCHDAKTLKEKQFKTKTNGK
jgi:5-methylcytosine-specific restriction endonuclease McrA